MLKIELHAQLRESLGPTLDIEIRFPARESDILAQIAARFPAHAELIHRSRIAVDDAYLAEGEWVERAGSMDLIAPVSGG